MPDLLDQIDIGPLIVRLRRRAARLSSDRTTAEDLVQETLLRLMETMERRPLAEPDHYAMVILHNLARAGWRSAALTDTLSDESACSAPVAEARLNLASLRDAIAGLPRDQAAVMELVLAGTSSPQEIARTLKIPSGTAMSRLARARVRLREAVGLGTSERIAELL